MLREAESMDAGALAEIYNQAMTPEVLATASDQRDDARKRSAWLKEHEPPYGVWVYEARNGEILGWCSLGVFPVRPFGRSVAEISVYVDARHRPGRLGATLLACLLHVGRQRGFRSLVSIAYERNQASVDGCLVAGFHVTARLREVAKVFGARENVVWVQRDLLDPDPPLVRAQLRHVEAQLAPGRAAT